MVLAERPIRSFRSLFWMARSSLLLRIFGAVMLTLDNKFNLKFIIVRSHISGRVCVGFVKWEDAGRIDRV